MTVVAGTRVDIAARMRAYIVVAAVVLVGFGGWLAYAGVTGHGAVGTASRSVAAVIGFALDAIGVGLGYWRYRAPPRKLLRIDDAGIGLETSSTTSTDPEPVWSLSWDEIPNCEVVRTALSVGQERFNSRWTRTARFPQSVLRLWLTREVRDRVEERAPDEAFGPLEILLGPPGARAGREVQALLSSHRPAGQGTPSRQARTATGPVPSARLRRGFLARVSGPSWYQGLLTLGVVVEVGNLALYLLLSPSGSWVTVLLVGVVILALWSVNVSARAVVDDDGVRWRHYASRQVRWSDVERVRTRRLAADAPRTGHLPRVQIDGRERIVTPLSGADDAARKQFVEALTAQAKAHGVPVRW